MEDYEKENLEKRLLTLIYGDSSDEASGLSLVQLREKKYEYSCENDSRNEYDSRKARLSQTVWEYEDCLYSEDFVDEKSFDEINKLIKYLWEKFIPDLQKEMDYTLHYIRRSLKRIIDRYRLKENDESLEYSNKDSNATKIDKADFVENYIPQEIDYETPIRQLFDDIQEKFSKRQDRTGKDTKKYLSSLITFRLIKEQKRKGTLDVLFFDVMQEYEFADIFLLSELKNAFNEGKKFPKQNEIAAIYGRDKTDAARTLKTFFGKKNKTSD